MSVLQQKPSGRLGDEEQSDGDNNREDELECKRESPLECASLEIQAVVHPIGETKGGSVRERPNNDELSAVSRLRALGLEDRASRRCQSHTEAVDYSANDHLREVPRGNL